MIREWARVFHAEAPPQGDRGRDLCRRNRYSDYEPNTAANGAVFTVGGQLVLSCPPRSRRSMAVIVDAATAKSGEGEGSAGRTRSATEALWRRHPRAGRKIKAGCVAESVQRAAKVW